MKSHKNPFLRRSSLATAATIALTTAAQAADLTWDNGAATGNWNTTDANWTGSTWTTGDNAIFNTTTGTVTLTEPISAGSFTFGTLGANTTGSFSGSPLTITGDLVVLADGNNGPGGPSVSFSNNVTVTGDLGIGRRVLEFTGGSVTVNRVLSASSWGRLLISGAAVTATNGIDDSINSGNTMSVVLFGGSLSTPYIKTTTAGFTGLPSDGVVLSGGTLIATASSNDFIQSHDPAGWGTRNNIGVGTDGANIDTNGFDISINKTMEDWAGSGSITKSGAGTLTLTAANSCTGGTTVNSGTLVLDGSAGGTSRVRGQLTVNTGATVSLINGDGTGLGYNAGAKVTGLTINGGTVTTAGALHVWNLGSGVNMTGGILQCNNGVSDANGPQMEWINANVTTNASADTATIGGRIRMRADGGAAGITFTVADGAAATDLLVSAAITEASGGRSITKTGAGTMVASGINTYTGVTVLEGGVLNASIFGNNGSSSSLGAGTGDTDSNAIGLLFRGGTLQYTGSTAQSTNRNIRLSTSGGGGTIDASGSDPSATLSFTSTASPNFFENPGDRTLTFTGSNTGDNTFAMAIGQAGGTTSVVKNGSGKWILSGANTYTGSTTVNDGMLSLSSANLGNESTVTIGFGAKIDLNFSGNDIIGNLEINGSGPLPAGLYGAAHPTYGSYFTGTGSLIVLNGADGLWTSLVDGVWDIDGNWDGGVIATGFDQTATFNQATGVTVTLSDNKTIGNLAFDNSDYILGGASTLTLDSSSIPAISVGTGRTATISANVGGTLGLEKTGAGTLVFTGLKSYTGGTTVTGGTLELSGANSGNAQIHGSLFVGSGATLAFTGGDGTGFGFYNSPVTSITVEGGTLNAAGGSHLGFGLAASLNLDSGASVLGSWNWNGDGLLSFSSSGELTNTIGGSVTLRSDAGADHTFNVNDGSAATDLQVNANLTDQWPAVWWLQPSNLTKSGDGTMVLNGTNTYDGNTVVSAGTLEVTASSTLRFRPTTNGATNKVSGSGTGVLSFLGTVDLDLGAANATGGNVWNLFDLASFDSAPSLSGTAGVTSNLGAFTEVSVGTWELAVTSAKWVFTEANGNLAYVVTATDYDNWEVANGVTGGENDDDDADGLTNFEEYAFGTDPTGGSSVNPIVASLDKATGTFSYTRRATPASTGLSYTVWTSTDLGTWTQDTGAIQGTPSVSGEVETVPVTISSALLSNSKLFIQVRAE